jgi:hypothetical protein
MKRTATMTIQTQHSAIYRINKITRYLLAIVGIILSSIAVTTTNPALVTIDNTLNLLEFNAPLKQKNSVQTFSEAYLTKPWLR